jgi:transposase
MPRNAAGIAGGAACHWVAVPPERDAHPVQRCGALTAALSALAAWLRQCQSETGVLESTGVSWIALFAGLEECGCDVKRVDAHDARQVPGRKTDVEDGQWLQELHTSGFLHGAFRPDEQVCVLRSSLRQRGRLVASASRAGQHMQKARAQMHRKLTEVVSAMTGKTGMEMLRALLAGERAPQRLALHRDRRCQHAQAPMAKALEGHGRAEPRLA